MTKLQEIERELAKLEEARAPLLAAKEVELSKTLIQCDRCKRKTQVRKLALHPVYSYREPFSCSGGDYVYHDYDLFECPKCDAHNRLRFHTKTYNSKYYEDQNLRHAEVMQFRRFFQKGERINTYT